MDKVKLAYDIPTAGVRVSFLATDEEFQLEAPCGKFDGLDKNEPGVWGFPQTPANLRRLASMLNAMAERGDGK